MQYIWDAHLFEAFSITTHTLSETVNAHFDRACLNPTNTFSETEPEPQGGDYLSAERRRTIK